MELTTMLVHGYEAEPSLEEKLEESYKTHKDTVKIYESRRNLDNYEREQYNYSRGYVNAFEELLDNNINIEKIRI